MNNREIEEIIRNSVSGIKKDFVAIKAWKEEPKHIPKYEGKAFPGLCVQIGEVLASRETFYVTGDQNYCLSGIGAFGLFPPRSEEEWLEVHRGHQAADSRGHINIETARRYYQVEEPKVAPFGTEKNVAVQVGLLRDIDEPDIVLIFCNPSDADIINRAYTWPTGELLKGFGSHAGCTFTLRYPYVKKEPSLTVGDIEWRHYIGLDDTELTLSFPYQSFSQFIEYFPDRVQYYRNYRARIEYLIHKTPSVPPAPETRAKFFGE